MPKATKEWDRIEDVLKEHEPYPGKEIGEKLCFYDDVDYYEVVEKKLVVNWEKYNLVKENYRESDTSPEAYEEQKALEEEKEQELLDKYDPGFKERKEKAKEASANIQDKSTGE